MTGGVETETQRFRTAAGGRIERARRLAFTFDGRALTGHPGDTLASALLAKGVHLVGRSFKYHRPRGILSAGSEEPNALVTVRRGWRRTTPNLRATEVELHEALEAHSQNRWPSLSADLGAVNDRFAPMLPAGFYYKMFMGPRWAGGQKAWTRFYEPAIRRMAGLGQAPKDADPDRYASRYAHVDVLVVGAGPAGIAAALEAAAAGASVMLADEQTEMGGALLAETAREVDGQPAWDWLKASLQELARSGRVQLLPRTTVFGCYPDHMFGLVERLSDHLAELRTGLPRERLWQVRAREVVLATGAIERPLVFPGNDRPGIMLAHAAQTYLHRYGVLAGTDAVIATESDRAYAIAADLAAHGVKVQRIVDRRPVAGEAARALADASGIPVTTGGTIQATGGRLRLDMATVLHSDGKPERVACNLLLMAGGFTPTLHLFSQLRGRLAWDLETGALLPTTPLPHVHVAGSAAGKWGLDRALADGAAAGEAASQALGLGGLARARASVAASPSELSGFSAAADRSAGMAPRTKGRAFVDFQNDVTVKDLELAAREGFTSIEHLKRYTTTGMATDQGKTSNVNAIGLVASSLARGPADVGHTTFRPPFTPVTFGAIAGEARGELLDPVRRTAIDGEARASGAQFEDVGQWQRAWYFPRGNESMRDAVARECRTVREAVGVFDGSTLGKIEVQGPGAADFLDRMYVNALSSLAVGRCRYALMLSDAGFVIDDGIVARLAPDKFHVTTTTGGAARVLAHMEDYLQTEFTDCRCWLTSTTEQWAVIAIQGPRARAVLEPLVDGLDISGAALPHMSVVAGTIRGVPMRLFRVSFTGELGYEVNVPAGYGAGIWKHMLAAAEAQGGTAYGTETMHVLRAEKGYIIVGQETDGTVTPGDLGLPQGKAKRDFVGKRGLARPDLVAAERPQLVGLECEDGGAPLEDGAQITSTSEPQAGTPSLGHVTSAYRSAVLQRPIALALVKDGRNRMNQTLFVPMPDGARRVRVVSPVFVDPEGKRIHD